MAKTAVAMARTAVRQHGRVAGLEPLAPAVAELRAAPAEARGALDPVQQRLRVPLLRRHVHALVAELATRNHEQNQLPLRRRKAAVPRVGPLHGSADAVALVER